MDGPAASAVKSPSPKSSPEDCSILSASLVRPSTFAATPGERGSCLDGEVGGEIDWPATDGVSTIVIVSVCAASALLMTELCPLCSRVLGRGVRGFLVEQEDEDGESPAQARVDGCLALIQSRYTSAAYPFRRGSPLDNEWPRWWPRYLFTNRYSRI